MFKCCECGHLFEDGEQIEWQENRGEFWGNPCSELMSGCPVCKGNYEKVEPCKICGSYDIEINEQYCNNCKENIKEKFNDLLNKNFTKEERKLLNELYDGEEI